MRRIASAVVGSVLLAWACAGSGVAAADTGNFLPIEAFMRNPDIGSAKLSPSGRWLAITVSPRGGRVLLAIVDLARSGGAPSIIVNERDADVRSFEWVNDDRLVFNIVDLGSAMMKQQFGPGLFSIRRDGTEMRMLIRPRWQFLVDAASRNGVQPLEPNHALLDVPEGNGDDVIVGKLSGDLRGDVKAVNPMRLNTVTGRAVGLAAGAPSGTTDWVFDPTGTPRVAVRISEGQREIFWRAPQSSEWKSIGRFPSNESAVRPLEVDRKGNLYVADTTGRATSVLKRFDFAAGRPERDPLVSTPGFDFTGYPIFDRVTGDLAGVRVETDATSTVWFDPDMKRLQAMVDERFPGHVNLITCRGCKTDGVLLVESYSDQDPGIWSLYRTASGSWETIGKSRPDIDPSTMARLDLFRFRARDGLEIPVWVTMPPGKPGGPQPAVVLVHGGPWVRGVFWEWNPEAQLLASRGYVVIEPEFRGSEGYGSRLFRRGFKQWGRAMQDDVADAVLWAAQRGLVDAKRVCIAGASYGGYATLMGLVRQPELYRCGVAWVAVTDPRLLYEDSWSSDTSRESREFTLPELVGDPDRDAALLRDAAPVEHAAEIRAPLLMAFGSDDVRVPLEHGTSLRSAMQKAGLHPEYVVYQGEGHGWLKVSNRVDFWNRVEAFLAVQLKQPVATAAAP